MANVKRACGPSEGSSCFFMPRYRLDLDFCPETLVGWRLIVWRGRDSGQCGDGTRYNVETGVTCPKLHVVPPIFICICTCQHDGHYFGCISLDNFGGGCLALMMLQAVRRDHLVRVHCHIHTADDPRPAEKWTGDFGCFFERYKPRPTAFYENCCKRLLQQDVLEWRALGGFADTRHQRLC